MSNPFENILFESRNQRALPARIPQGDRPVYAFEISDNWTLSRLSSPQLTSSVDFSGVPFDCDLAALAKQAGRALRPIEVDFMWMALAVYMADRFASRSPYGQTGRSYWRRKIHVTVPVSDRKRWQALERRLVKALAYLTEDDWTFKFTGGRRPFNEEDQAHFPQLTPPRIAWAALFSGGLDSAAGAVNWLSRDDGRALLISGQTNGRIAVGQREQVAELRAHFPQRVDHVGVGYGLPDKTGITGFESSQRTRAFVHVTMGAIAARVAGAEKLMLFENGFGALNLACDSAQIGSQNSRGTHPVFLRRMAEFIAGVFEQPFAVENPYGFATKAEMLLPNADGSFNRLFQKSFSCDRYPNYPHKAPQCGRCASCLVRRMSLHAAGLPDDPSGYTFDIFAGKPFSQLRDVELLAQVKLAVQAEALAERLYADAPWERLTEMWPELLRAETELNRPDFKLAVSTLLKRHVTEWRAFSAAAHSRMISVAA
jgi:7-cyano-7-deazaguanine synthase in queuosine biosynthesis